MGPLQRLHLTQSHHLSELAAQIVDHVVSYPGNGDYRVQELQAPLLLLAMLFRRYAFVASAKDLGLTFLHYITSGRQHACTVMSCMPTDTQVQA